MKAGLWWKRTLAVAALVASGGAVACNDNGGSPGPVPVARVEVTPATGTIDVGATTQLTAKAYDANSKVLAYTITWTGDEYASVNASGLVTGLKVGTARITATTGGKSAVATFTVEPAVAVLELAPATAEVTVGKTVTLTATPKDAAGEPVARTVAWTSSDNTLATVANGVVTGVKVGTVTITASAGDKTATAAITVVPPVAGVAITPAVDTIVTGDSVKLAATLTDSAGATVTRPVTWASDNALIAPVDTAGMVRGLAQGAAVITATSEGMSATANIVVLMPVAKLVVEPTSISIWLGETSQITASAFDADNNPLEVPIQYTSADPAVATVSGTGLVAAVDGGTTTINVRAGTATAAIPVEVLVPIASMTVASEVDSILPSETVQMTTVQLDAKGRQIPSRPVTWESSDPAIATVSESGVLTGVAPGTVTITASAEGKGGSKQMGVKVPVSSVTVTAPVTAMMVGGQIQLNAIAKDAGGNPLNRPPKWTSSNEAVATIEGSGLAHGIAKGSATLTATVDGVSGTMNVSVTNRAATITVAWPTKTITEEGVGVFADVRDADGAQIVRQVTWTSSNPAVLSPTVLTPVTAHLDYKGSGTAVITATIDGLTTTSPELSAKGPPSSEEETGNSLSWPTIFANGFDIANAPVATDAAMRPLSTETAAYAELVDSAYKLPFFYSGNVADWLGTHYIQGGTNVWRAQWADGTTMGNMSSAIDWGDNLLAKAWTAGNPIRVEVGLYGLNMPTMQGYNMFLLTGSGTSEVQGTDGSVGDFQPMIFTSVAHLRIESISGDDGQPTGNVIFDGTVADGSLTAELNVAGKIVYGYQMKVTTAGWYRLTFSLDGTATVGGTSVSRNLTIDQNIDPVGEAGFTPRLENNGTAAYLDIQVVP